MADFNFPLNPQVNDLYTLNDRTFRYDGAKWRYISLSLVTVTSGTAVTSINSLTNSAQVFSVGSSGSGFNISSSGLTHTFNIPIAGSGSTGLITTQTQTIAGAKTFSSDLLVSSSTASTNTTTGALSVSGGAAIGGSLNVAGRINLWNSTNCTSFVSSASGNTVYTLPATSPATGTSVLQSTSAGVMSWVPMTVTASGSGTGLSNLNTLTDGIQYFSTGTSGSIFNISSSGSTHTFNIPIAGSASTGLISTSSQTIAGQKTFTSAIIGDLTGTATTSGFASTASYANQSGYAITSGSSSTANTATYSHQSGYAITSGSSAFASTASYSYTSGYGITAGLATTSTYAIQSGYAITSGSSSTASTATYSNQSGYAITSGSSSTSGLATTSTYSHQSGYAITSGSSSTANTATYANQSGYAITSGSSNTSGLATSATYSHQSGYGLTSGTATTAANVNVVFASTSTSHPLLFTPTSGSASGVALSSNSTLVYNPSTDRLSVSGLAVTSVTTSTSTSTGALIVSGGVGVGGTIFSSGLNIQDNFTLGSQIFYPQNTRGFSVNENYNPVGSGASHTAYHFTSGVGRASIYFDLAISNQYTVMFGTYGSAAGNTFVIGSETANSDFEFRSTLGIQPVRLDLGTLLMRISRSGNVSIPASTTSTSTSTGALSVSGGVGIGGSLYVASATAISGITINAGVITGSLTGTATTSTYSLQAGYAITSGTATTSGFATTASYSYQSGYGLTSGLATTSTYSHQSGYAITSGSSSFASTASYSYQSGYGLTSGLATTANYAHQSGYAITSGSSNTSGYATTSGLATTSTNINVVSATTNASHPVLFTPAAGTASGAAVSSETSFVYNPSTDILSVSGLAITSGTASTSSLSGALTILGGVGIGSSLNVGGRVGIGTNLLNATLNVRTSSSSTPGLVVQGSTSQTADYAQFFTSTGATSITITKDAEIKFPLAQDIKIYATAYGSVGAIKTTGNIFAYGGLIFAYGVSDELSSVLSPTSLSVSGLNWSTYSSGSTIRWATNNAVRIQPTSTSVVPLHINNQSASWTSGNAFEIANNGDLRFSIDYTGSTRILSTVGSASTTSGALVVSGGAGIAGSIFGGSTISAADNIEIKSAKELRLNNSGNTFYTGLKAGSNASNTTYTLPVAFPSTGSSVLQSTSAGVMSWVPMTASGGLAISGSADGTVQFKSGSSLGATNSLFFDTSLLGLRVSGFPGGSTPSSTDAALKVEQTVSSFNGSTSGTMIAVNANTGFAGDLMNLQVNAVSRFRIDNTGAIIQNIGTNSTSTTSGSVQVRGGVGITGAVYVGESVNATSLTQSTSTTSGSLVVSGGAGIAQSVSVGGRLQLFNSSNYTAFVSSASGNTVYTLPATSPSTGSSVLQSTSAGVMSWVPMTAASSSGNTSQNIAINTVGNANVLHPVLMTPSGLSSGSAISSDTTFLFNPSTEILYVSGLAVTSRTVSTSTSSGALVVNGGLGVLGQLTFANASFGFTGITSNPTMSFIGATSSSPITLTVLTDNSLSWEGSSGQVFAIDSNLSTGEIFAVSDISGIPIISASAGQTVTINEFGGFTRIGNGSISSTGASNTGANGTLVVYGGVGITGNTNIGGAIRAGGGSFAKNISNGDIALDNSNSDTPGVLYYWQNNKNIGTDVYFSGSGVTRYRIVKELNESGGTELWSIDREGIVYRSSWAIGETISTSMYNNSDLNMQSTNTVGITSYVTIATITYTPKSSSSYLWIEFDAHYDFNNGSTADDFFARITVGGSTIVEKNQIFVNASGGGTRSGVLFPISGRYTNTSTSGIAITVQARRGTADDNLRVYGSSTSGYMRIQEIGR